jgi:hypothetical protein
MAREAERARANAERYAAARTAVVERVVSHEFIGETGLVGWQAGRNP